MVCWLTCYRCVVVVQVEQNVEASQKSLTDKNMEHAKVRNTASASLPYYLCATLLGHRGGQGGHNVPSAESLGMLRCPNNVTSTFFNTVHFHPKDPKLASCPGRHLTFVCPWLGMRDCYVRRVWSRLNCFSLCDQWTTQGSDVMTEQG